MIRRKNNIAYLAQASMIAALYAVMTYAAAALNLAFGAVQFRFSEALTVLPLFSTAAIPGLALGCFISNLGSPLGLVDWIFGTAATLLAAVSSRALRNVTIKNIPVLSVFMPVIFNMLIVGFEIACLSDTTGKFGFQNFSALTYLYAGISVGAGEMLICVLLGIPLIIFLKRIDAQKRIFEPS